MPSESKGFACLVCRAWHYTSGCEGLINLQVPRGPTGGNPIAKVKGVSGDRKSEGRLRQIPGADEQKLNSRPVYPGKRSIQR